MHMSMLKKKTRKAIRKSFKKFINKHGPDVAEHLLTALAAATATYVGASGKKGHKKLRKVAKTIPGAKRILEAISSTLPSLKGNGHETNGHDEATAEAKTKRGKRSKKHHAA
jgi:hypothetical protein